MSSIVRHKLNWLHNGRVEALGGCGARAFATEPTTMRVEMLKSREISQVASNTGLARSWLHVLKSRDGATAGDLRFL